MIRPQQPTPPTTRPRRPPTHTLTLLTEPTYIPPATKALLHTLFFHRLFPAVRPLTRDLTFPPPTPRPTTTRIHATPNNQRATHAPPPDPPTLTYPLVDDPDLETTLSDRAAQLSKLLDRALAQNPAADAHALVRVHFYEKKRKKAATGFANFWKEADVNGVCWESWEVRVGARRRAGRDVSVEDSEEEEEEDEDAGEGLVQQSMGSVKAAMAEVVRIAGEEKEHIPPITSAEANPFPYEVVVEGVGK